MLGLWLRTLFSRFLFLLLMLAYLPFFLIMLLLPKEWLYDSRLFFLFTDIFYNAVIKFSLLPITFVGAENVPQSPAIIVANHQSSLDIPLVGALVKRHPHIWLAKEELTDSPILRFILPRVAVLVDPTSPLKAMRSLLQIINLVNGHNRHVMIFPEGTRHTDGKVHDFFSGFVILAKKTGRPVVPVRIFNLHKVYPPESFLVHYYPVKVVVGQPMYLQEGEEDEAFKQRVYQWFIMQSED